MKTTIIILLLSLLTATSCAAKEPRYNTNLPLSDEKVIPETILLYKKLNQLTQKGFLFGHQHVLAYGVNWKYKEKRSDIKYVVGDYLAIFGLDIAGLEKEIKIRFLKLF